MSLCKCGCGQPVPLRTRTNRRRGYAKGDPCDYLPYHGPKVGGRPRDLERPVKVAEAQRLIWDEGLTHRQVADRMGVNISSVHNWMADPDGSKARAKALAWHFDNPRESTPEQRAHRARLARERRRKTTTVLDYSTAKGADGPRFVAWLEQRGELRGLTETELRAVHRWRRPGAVAQLDAVDRLLTRLSILDFEVPEDLWLDTARGRAA